jgi:hydrogenase maturation protein HypF
MCPQCRAEYDDPGNRRFHAQPNACPRCGPRLQLRGADGRPIAAADPVAATAAALRGGQIVALKGLGGYHLVCDATVEAVVTRLRHRKHRDEKPLALMVRDVAAARRIAHLDTEEEALLRSHRRPIVLLRRQGDAAVAAAVAPGHPCLGVMLPYTPLHHLLLHAVEAMPLVMTSGNRSDEPIAYEDGDALERLAAVADVFLTHDRPIAIRCDDSVTRIAAGAELPVRRSRGYAPEPFHLPRPCPRPSLALGGQLKATFALGRGRHAVLSHHLGDLDHYEALRAYEQAIAYYEQLFAIRPELIVHDLHPDYASTRYALERATSGGTLCLGVQHHEAHVASCMAEHGLDEPVIGVAFDGTGYGSDGTVWGGEFFSGDYHALRREAHLRYVPMPGGEQAIREPWRMAAAHLRDAGRDDHSLRSDVPEAALATVRRQMERQFNAPQTSSAGRLFDAVAALCNVRRRVSFEGQAAIELEGVATGREASGTYPFGIEPSSDGCLVVDTRPLIAAIDAEVLSGREPSLIGRRFHATMAEIIVQVCLRLARASGLDAVVLSGGVFLNALLLEETTARLAHEGFRVYRHRRVPPGDGGICLGQLAIAAARHDLC